MGGAWKERRGGVLEGVDAPMHTLNLLEEGEGEKNGKEKVSTIII